jgi:uncharacterized protein (DUF983 family)
MGIEIEGQRRDGLRALFNGLRGRCPACGKGRMFHAFLKVSDQCPACQEELHHHQADDAPAYFDMLLVGHTIVPMVLSGDRRLAMGQPHARL